MARPKRGAAAAAAAAPATPAVPPLDGCVVTSSGKLTSFGFTQVTLDKAVTDLGGRNTKTFAVSTTHVICSDEDWNYPTNKVRDGKSKGLWVLSPDWVAACQKANARIDEKEYEWSTGKAKPPAPAPSKKRNATAAAAAAGVDADEAEPIVKRPKAEVKPDGEEEEEKADLDGDAKVEDNGQIARSSNKTLTIRLDEYCPLKTYVVYLDENDMIYDASLNQANSVANNNKFYRIQLLEEKKSKTFKTWTRWGRVGDIGQSAILGDGTLESAMTQFNKKFKDKSGLSWENRTDPPKKGKYAFVELNYASDSDEEGDDDGTESKVKKEEDGDAGMPECTLAKPVQGVIELMFNQNFFQAAMSSLNYDANKLPLGKLGKNTIMRGFKQLKELSDALDDPKATEDKWGEPLNDVLVSLSNTYYSLVPHDFGRNRPPVIRDNALLKKEIELLESLSDMKDASDILKADRKVLGTHPLDRQFQGLCLNEMSPLDHDSSEFKSLATYLNGSKGSTHNVQYGIEHIFRIERQGEKLRFDSSPYASRASSDRRLLWHGSRCTNFGGILSQGLRIAPPEAPSTGYMFGKGIYLADMSSKSANYCASYISQGHALLLLCEAELGDPMLKLKNANYRAGEDAKKQDMISTWGMGRTEPQKWIDAGGVHPSLKGIKIPDPKSPPSSVNDPGRSLYYNEFIVYDVAQVRLRYLFWVKM